MSNPPANFILTDIGIDSIKLNALAATRTILGGVRFGDSSAVILAPTVTNVAGNVVYTATPAQMFVSNIGRNEVIIRCRLDHTVGDFDIGSFAFLNDTGVPIWVGRMEYIHKKMKSTIDKAGGRFEVQFRFIMLDLHTHFDFTNLTEHFASFDTANPDIKDAPQYPVHSLYYEIQVDTVYQDSGRNGYPLHQGAKGRQWFTSPFQLRDDDADFWQLDGGFDGDSYQYIP